MERIASFCVDHTRLLPGMYLSRQDGDVLTWDIRMKRPNQGDYLSTGAAHTLEHLFATYARNSAWSQGVIYVGPMGCRTGFYLLTRGLTPAEALALTAESFRFMASYDGPIPGASEVECGNWQDMDLPAARAEAAAMVPVLEALTADLLSREYRVLNEAYFGPDMVSDGQIALEWSRIPHFYYNYYVFQYATGYSAAIALSRRILQEGEPAVKDYLEFLSGGCSKDPIDLLKGAGVDMASPQPIQAALDLFDSLLDEMETLTDFS